MTVDVAFSSPQLMGQTGSISQQPNKASIARTVDQEITMCLERIEEYAKQLWRLIERMKTEELWIDLGYRTYREYLDSVRERTGKVPAALRTPIRKQLEASGASDNEIAAVTGTTRQTVINDRNAERGVKNFTPHASAENIESALAAGEQTIVDAEIVADGNESADAIVTADEFDAGCQINLFKLMTGLSARIVREGTWQPESLAQAKQIRRNIGKIDKLLERYIEANA